MLWCVRRKTLVTFSPVKLSNDLPGNIEVSKVTAIMMFRMFITNLSDCNDVNQTGSKLEMERLISLN